MTLNADRARKVAIIGVHGVGDQVAGATSAAIARLLEVQHRKKYRSFTEQTIKIPVATDELAISPAGAAPKTFRQRVGLDSPFHKGHGVPGGAPTDIAFTASLLHGGCNYTSHYETSFWHGEKCDGANKASLDVYEMYWSDLSHGSSSSSFAVLGQFIQLLVHIASLGRTTAATVLPGVAEERQKSLWQAFYALNAASYWLLAMPILIGNFWLILLGALFIAVTAAGHEGGHIPEIASLMLGIECAACSGWLLYRDTSCDRLSPISKTTCAILLGCATGVAWLLVDQECKIFSPLSLPLFLALSFIGYLMMAQYQIMRPGALGVWVFIGIPLAAGIGVSLVGPSAFAFSVRTWYESEIFFVVLLLSGMIFFVVNCLLLTLGILIKARTKNEAERNSANTCMATALLPGPLFLALIVWFWSMVGIGFNDLPSGEAIDRWHWLTGWKMKSWLSKLLPIEPPAAGLPSWRQLLAAMIDGSARLSFLYYDVAAVLALVFVLAILVPSAFAEFIPPSMKPPLDQQSTGKLGTWLDEGFVLLGRAGRLVLAAFLAAFILDLGFGLCAIFDRPPRCFSLFPLSLGFGTGGAALGYLAATKALSANVSNAFGRLRVPVDTLLDIDNWLRERPRGNTMRLHVFARFTSLLRYLRAQDYHEIVFVAHSQGSVITADLLRYLEHLKGQAVGAIAKQAPTQQQKLRLLTMGCPLRQLYAWRVPALYGWADQNPPFAILGPDPAALGLASWNNAYGSGDYIGRNLWQSAAPFTLAAIPLPHPIESHEDFCVGPIAHTHYLDEKNTMIAACIDRLI